MTDMQSGPDMDSNPPAWPYRIVDPVGTDEGESSFDSAMARAGDLSDEVGEEVIVFHWSEGQWFHVGSVQPEDLI